MKHAIGVALLVGLAFLLRWWIPSTIFFTTGSTRVVNGVYSDVRVARGSLNVIVFGGLIGTFGCVGFCRRFVFRF